MRCCAGGTRVETGAALLGAGLRVDGICLSFLGLEMEFDIELCINHSRLLGIEEKDY